MVVTVVGDVGVVVAVGGVGGCGKSCGRCGGDGCCCGGGGTLGKTPVDFAMPTGRRRSRRSPSTDPTPCSEENMTDTTKSSS